MSTYKKKKNEIWKSKNPGSLTSAQPKAHGRGPWGAPAPKGRGTSGSQGPRGGQSLPKGQGQRWNNIWTTQPSLKHLHIGCSSTRNWHNIFWGESLLFLRGTLPEIDIYRNTSGDTYFVWRFRWDSPRRFLCNSRDETFNFPMDFEEMRKISIVV